ncbi:MAG TPA: LPS assembly lipoprotein LptE [Vicinamibacterales bacterium]|nr:LPS assembly lipoprotein LptE [Vicinamibacterales bacterium]
MTRLALPLIVMLVHAGCGYALAGRGSFLPAYIRVVGIPPIENRSQFQQIEQVLTEKIRTEFIGRGKYTVLPDAPGSDAVLTGEIIGISLQPVAFNERQLASRYQFILTMKMTFTDSRTNMVLWSNDALTFREEYELSANTSSTGTIEGGSFFDQERSTVDRLSTDAARSVVTAILEAF